MQLSPQTIKWYCECPSQAMIDPFTERHVHKTGLSGGLSCAGYDVHLGRGLERPVDADGNPAFDRGPIKQAAGLWIVPPRTGVLGVTKERFNIPPHIAMQYFNKSTLARRFINACATLAEPGWCGHLTLEIYNQTDRVVYLQEGQPIGQVVFHELDKRSAFPYKGKYQNQGYEPVQAKEEKEEE